MERVKQVVNNFRNFSYALKSFRNDMDENIMLKYYILYLIYHLKFKSTSGGQNEICDFISYLGRISIDKYCELEDVINNLTHKEKINQITETIKLKPTEFGWFMGSVYSELQNIYFKKTGGSFYTPNEIIKYLVSKVIDEKQIIKNPYIKILDPACGSGFFLYELYKKLAEIYLRNISLINSLHPDIKLTKENICLHIIENNLHGMDIDPIGTLITKIGLLELSSSGTQKQEAYAFQITCCDSLFHTNNESYDIVIGNPPWVSFGLRGLEKVDKKLREKLIEELPFSSQYKISYYSLFIEKGIKSLKRGGKLAFITPDSYLLGHYFTNLRKYILEQGYIKEITLLGKSLFKGVNAGYEALLLFEKALNPLDKESRYGKEVVAQWAKDIKELIDNKTKSYRYSSDLFLQNEKARFYLCFDEISYEIINKLADTNSKFDDYIGFYSGCIGRYGQKSIIADNRLSEVIIKNKQGDFIWQDDNADTHWYPLIDKGSKIKAFYISPSKAYIYIHPDEKIRKLYGKSGFKLKIYREPKILLRQTGDKLVAAYDDKGFFTLNNIHLMYSLKENKDELLYCLGLLNSNLYNYYYQIISMEKGRILAQIDLDVIKELPFITGSKHQTEEVIGFVKEIIKYYDKKGDVILRDDDKILIKYKGKINNLVYDIANVKGKLRQYIEENI